MIPWGPWRPDSAGVNTPVLLEARNVLPSTRGFLPIKSPVSSSAALDAACQGAVTVRLNNGDVRSFAGTADSLYRLQNDVTWSDVSGTTYATAAGERWRFEVFGDLLIATNFTDAPQKYDLTGSGTFSNLGGSPPNARYMAVVRDFLVLGAITNNERRVQWSAINDVEGWTVGTASSDFQDFPSGGPVMGIIGGETGYIWQAEKVTRMTFLPGDAAIFQFDEVEGGRGLLAPNSLVKLGAEAFYLGTDGFYRFSLAGGASQQIGTGKWHRWFFDDMRAGTELEVFGGVSPRNRAILWFYVSRDNPGTTPDRALIYDWVLDEATFMDVSAEAVADWLTQGYTLDTINSFGTLDELPYSLDSPFWKGGQGLVGIFSPEHKLTHLEGSHLEAQFVTADGEDENFRTLVQGTRPHIDSSEMTVAIASREADGDSIVYEADEQREDTGEVPAHVSGNYHRARITVPAGASWSRAAGIKTMVRRRGRR